MPRIGWVIAALAVGLTAGAARAGVYALDDPAPRVPAFVGDYKAIRLVLDPLRTAVIPVVPDQPAEKLRQLAVDLEAKVAALEAQAAELQAKPTDPAARLAELQAKLADLQPQLAADRHKLGACYLRLGRPNDAAQALAKADDNNYLVRLHRREAELEAKPPADLTTADRINLGACYLREGRPNNAVEVLSAADQGDFLVLANLAAAYQAIGELERAVAYEEQALDAWPSIHAGWSGGALQWYRRAEGYYLKLLKLRLREAAGNPAVRQWSTMDALFDRPRVAGAAYGPEMQPWKVWGDLPPDAYALTAQLLVWAPNDDRLYWQLGELLNTGGQVQDAYSVLDELVQFRNESSVQELREHRRILGNPDTLGAVNAVNQVTSDPARFPMDFYTLMWAVSPRGLLLPPVGGDLANEAAMAAQANAYALQAQAPVPANPPPAPPPNTPAGWQPDWRTLFVGFTLGVVLATLGALQWMEWRRRRAAPRPKDVPPPRRPEPTVHDAGAFPRDAPAAPDRVEGAP